MTTQLSAHLSDEALNDVLIGLSSTAADAHLAVCPHCRGQLDVFRSEMQLFNQTSLAWGEARSAKTARPATIPKVRKAILAPAGLAIAAMILLAIGLPVWNHHHRSTRDYAVAPAPAQQDSAEQIAQDNELLRSVDMALSTNEESPISEYYLSGKPRPHPKTRTDESHKARPESRKR